MCKTLMNIFTFCIIYILLTSCSTPTSTFTFETRQTLSAATNTPSSYSLYSTHQYETIYARVTQENNAFHATLAAMPSPAPSSAAEAMVEIEVPETLTPGQLYNIIFREMNGVGVVLNEHDYILSCDDGYFHRISPRLMESQWIIIEPYGHAEVETYVPSEWDNCRHISGWYEGIDVMGKEIMISRIPRHQG